MKAILDTGPWVALIDRSEAMHDACVEWFESYKGKLYSTEAILTEVLFLLNFSITAQSAALDFVLKSAVEIVTSSIESLKRSKRLMEQYSDLPMDFADATAVSLAKEAEIDNIVTLDRKHFSIYRLNKKRAFAILP